MSLRSAVQKVSELMAQTAMGQQDQSFRNLLLVFVGQLQVALEAAGEGNAAPSPSPVADPEYQNWLEIKKAREELRAGKQPASQEAPAPRRDGPGPVEAGLSIVEVRDGDEDGLFVEIDPRMPVGAWMRVGADQVYQLQNDGGRVFLQFSPEQTEKLRTSQQQAPAG